MVNNRVLNRDEIPERYTWNAPSVFSSWGDWEEEVAALSEDLSTLSAFQGRIDEGPEVLAEALDAVESLARRVGKVYVYALMNQAVDVRDQDAALATGKARGLFGKFLAQQAFLDPELLAIGEETLDVWMEEEPRLAEIRHYVDNLFRQQAHVRSAEVEEVLGLVADPFSGTQSTASVLTNADFDFEPAINADDEPLEITQGSLKKILASSDRKARRTAWTHYADEYLAHKNTLASNLETSIKQNVFEMRVRRYESTLDMSLFARNVPTEVFYNLIDTFRKHLPTWHRYWKVRRQALGVDTLHPYDVWAPLTSDRAELPYEQAVDWISEGLAPMGDAYVDVLRKGALEQRWVDVYPNRGKRAGAFSAGRPGTYPFIMMSFNDDIFSLSTLAHELGHSMHSYLTWEHQPFIYSGYSLFVAEVASNFHQAMVRHHLLETQEDPALQISIIEEAMSNFHRYFFIMPTLARFELEVHQRVESGQGLNADSMIALMADLFAEGYGDEVEVDRERVGITWATFGHLYIDYYVYQYATGISGAHALAARIQAGEPGAVEDYLSFLKSGGSRYPLDILKDAGVDLTTPEAVEVTFGVLDEMVDRLETLVG
jgi:oligoendopeptidase F